MSTANVKAVITAEDKASNVISGVGASFGKMASAMAVGQLAATAFHKAFSLVTDNIGSAIKRVDTLNNSSRVFENMGFKAGDTAKAMKALEASINGLPTPLDAAVRNMQLIAASTGDISKSQQIFSAMNDAIIGFGGSTDMVNNAMIQLSQAFSNGRIDAQTWNSMMQSGLGPTLNAIAKQMKITTGQLKEGLSDGSISVETFQDKLVELDTKGGGGLKSLHQIAKDATAGIGTGLDNMKTAITRGIASVIKALGSANISETITKIGSNMEKALKALAKAIDSPTFKNAVQRLKQWLEDVAESTTKIGRAVGDYLGPKFQALGNTLKDAMPTFEKLWRDVLSPLAKLLGEVLVGALGFAVDALNAFMKVLTPVVDWMLNNKGTVTAFAAAFGVLYGSLKMQDALDTLKNGISTVMDNIGSLKNKLGDLIAYATGPGGWALIAAAGVAAAMLVYDAWRKAWDAVNQTNNAIDSMKKSNQSAIDQVKKSMSEGKISIEEGQKKIKSLEQDMNSVNKNSFWNNLKDIPGNFWGGLTGRFRAAGGPVQSNTSYVVGEKGPELFVPHASGRIVPNHQIGTSSNVNINVSFSGVFTGNEMEFRKLANKVFNAYKDSQSMRGA